MTTASITGTDVRLRNTVIRHLDWSPELDASAIGASATEGVVTLTGFTDSYVDKLTAERVAKRLRGVRAVANDIVVRLSVDRTDEDIARDAARALATRQAVGDVVQAAVHRGHVTLTGSVEWLFQKQVAEDLIRHVRGVAGVHNHIAVKPRAEARDVKRRITRALHEHADLEARHIQVTAEGAHVRLRGTVTTWTEREAAERAAVDAPGVTQVDNEIAVVAMPLADDDTEEIC
jgi:osmotically-inducible protein OsmY